MVERARQFPGQEKQVWDYYRNNPGALAQLRAPIFEDKVVDFILELANVTENKVTREELAKEEPTTRGLMAGVTATVKLSGACSAICRRVLRSVRESAFDAWQSPCRRRLAYISGAASRALFGDRHVRLPDLPRNTLGELCAILSRLT